MKIEFDYVIFSKWVGTLCILFAFAIIVNIVVMEVFDVPNDGLMRISFQYLIYGVIVFGIGKLVDLFGRHYQEMKFFRKHYIEKDKQIADVLKNNEDEEK